MEDSFDDEELERLFTFTDGDFWLYAAGYSDDDEALGKNLSYEEELAEYEERNNRYWLLKKELSPPRSFDRTFPRGPPILLSPSKTGFDLIVKEGSPSVGWGATMTRNPRTSSPFKTAALPVLNDVSPVAADHPSPQRDVENEPPLDISGDDSFRSSEVQAKFSETKRRVSQVLIQSTNPNRTRSIPNTFDGNETFVAQPAPVDPCARITRNNLDNTFEVDSADGESPDEFNGTFTKENEAEGTFVLNGETENGDIAHQICNATFVAPPEIEDRRGSAGRREDFVSENNSFASPAESIGANSRGSRESVCSGVSADSDSLAVNQTSNLGRSMPNLAMKPRIGLGGRSPAPRGLGQIRESALPMPGAVGGRGAIGGRLPQPKSSLLPPSSVRNAPAYRSESKLNETSSHPKRLPGLRLTGAVANGPASRRAPGGSATYSYVANPRPGPSSMQGTASYSRYGQSRPGPGQAGQPAPVNLDGGGAAGRRLPSPAEDKFATFRKNSSAFNQRRDTVVLNATMSLEPQGALASNAPSLIRTQTVPVQGASRPTSAVPSRQPTTANTSGIARPSKLPGPGTSRIAKFAPNSAAFNGTLHATNNSHLMDSGQGAMTFLPRKQIPRPPLYVPQWDDDCY